YSPEDCLGATWLTPVFGSLDVQGALVPGQGRLILVSFEAARAGVCVEGIGACPTSLVLGMTSESHRAGPGALYLLYHHPRKTDMASCG
uniref:Uncharacterized protein n=1 Tax=Terrapene triunguis TaxID=2587831 RepID=A0A674ICK3_9SAUR